jgi:hypothetical protein
MATPPTLVSSTSTVFNTTTSPKSVTLTTQAGDYVVVVAGTENASELTNTPSGNGLTFTLLQSETGGSNVCESKVWVAQDSTGGTSWTLSATHSATSTHWGFTATVWRGSDGYGASAKNTVTDGVAPSLDLTTTADNSAIVYGSFDWNAISGSSRTWRTINSYTPTSANGGEDSYALSSGRYTEYTGHWLDVGSTGTKTTGLSAPGGQKPSIVAVEIKGAGSSALTGEATLSATASITATALVERFGGASLAVTASMAAAGAVDRPATGALVTSADLSAAATVGAQGAASLAAVGALSAGAFVNADQSAQLSVTTSITAIAVVSKYGEANLSATVSMFADSEPNGTASLAVTSSLYAIATVQAFATSSLSAIADMDTIAIVGTFGESSLSAVVAISAEASTVAGVIGVAVLNATVDLTASGNLDRAGIVSLTAQAALLAEAVVGKFATATLAVIASMNAERYIAVTYGIGSAGIANGYSGQASMQSVGSGIPGTGIIDSGEAS